MPPPTGRTSPGFPSDNRLTRMRIRPFASLSRSFWNQFSYSSVWRISITDQLYPTRYKAAMTLRVPDDSPAPQDLHAARYRRMRARLLPVIPSVRSLTSSQQFLVRQDPVAPLPDIGDRLQRPPPSTTFTVLAKVRQSTFPAPVSFRESVPDGQPIERSHPVRTRLPLPYSAARAVARRSARSASVAAVSRASADSTTP